VTVPHDGTRDAAEVAWALNFGAEARDIYPNTGQLFRESEFMRSAFLKGYAAGERNTRERVEAAVAEEQERIATQVAAWMSLHVYPTKESLALLQSIRSRAPSATERGGGEEHNQGGPR